MLAHVSRELFIISIMRFYNKPYIWGGSGPVGYDCSGLVESIYKGAGIPIPGRLNSQQLHDQLNMGPVLTPEQCDLGDLLFFGESKDNISHVALGLGYGLMYEAAHGDHTCTTPDIAYARGAMVMANPINHRRDLVAIIKKPFDWPTTSAPTSGPT